ncbi:hypothetical protein AVEN_48755-1 [Araneus ventricosus]|uniref:RNase H type-1 domain-containing protein n=1 Tax=Araneus ventricosus TaxID=182803 RepID=A0A4Y2UM92_ARAVE|nr:hypothetical protein AVEN_48755-1 [Araneus ventricosus]
MGPVARQITHSSQISQRWCCAEFSVRSASLGVLVVICPLGSGLRYPFNIALVLLQNIVNHPCKLFSHSNYCPGNREHLEPLSNRSCHLLGSAGVPGNEMKDQLARQASHDGTLNIKIDLPNSCPKKSQKVFL